MLHSVTTDHASCTHSPGRPDGTLPLAHTPLIMTQLVSPLVGACYMPATEEVWGEQIWCVLRKRQMGADEDQLLPSVPSWKKNGGEKVGVEMMFLSEGRWRHFDKGVRLLHTCFFWCSWREITWWLFIMLQSWKHTGIRLTSLGKEYNISQSAPS